MRVLCLLVAALTPLAAQEPFCVEKGRPVPCKPAQRQKAAVPRIDPQVSVASATRSPWLVSNGWLYRRNPDRKYEIDAREGGAVRAAAEAIAFSGTVLIHAGQAEAAGLAKLRQAAARLPRVDLPEMADFEFVDDGRAVAGEILNLFARRNMLARGVAKPSGALPVIRIGDGELTGDLARNPSEFAYAVRQKLGDDSRSLRVFGTEMAIVRVLSDGRTARVHAVNYSDQPLEGVRIRVRGSFTQQAAYAGDAVEDLVQDNGFTEFTFPEFDVYAVVDLRR